MINIKRKYLDIFKRYFKDISFDEEEICDNNFRLKFLGALRDRSNFYKYKKSLEENSFGNETIEFKHGYAHEQRIDAVESLFGCGNGDFVKRLQSSIFGGIIWIRKIKP